MNLTLQIINQCQLDCKFCGFQHLTQKQKKKMTQNYMSFDIFKRIVDAYIIFSNTPLEINMTPVLGEAMLDRDISQKFYYLENKDDVKEYFVVTNLIRVPMRFFDKVKDFEKLSIIVSVYGDNREGFYQTTRRDMYEKFVDNLDSLARTRIKNVELHLRKEGVTPPYSMLFKTVNMIENNNIAGLIPDGSNKHEVKMPQKTGICANALYNSVTADGNICICDNADYRYTGKQSIIGNMFEQKLDQIYDINTPFYDIITGQSNRKYPEYCQRCNEYETVDKREIFYIMKTIPWLEDLV